MKKALSLAAALLLVVGGLTLPARAQASSPVAQPTGLWMMFITVAGAPPCQCIQITRFHEDGSLDGPANDHFSGAVMGEWRRISENSIRLSIVQNNINADGSAGGVYVIKGTMKLDRTGEQASGSTDFEILAADRSVIASGTATFTGTRIKP